MINTELRNFNRQLHEDVVKNNHQTTSYSRENASPNLNQVQQQTYTPQPIQQQQPDEMMLKKLESINTRLLEAERIIHILVSHFQKNTQQVVSPANNSADQSQLLEELRTAQTNLISDFNTRFNELEDKYSNIINNQNNTPTTPKQTVKRRGIKPKAASAVDEKETNNV